MIAIARELARKGEQDPAHEMIEVRRLIRMGLASSLESEARLGPAEKAFKMAEFYRRSGHAASACFYYEMVRRRFPDSTYGARAVQASRELHEMATLEQAKLPLRVGAIKLVGNTRTEATVILNQLKLAPGEVLTYAALRAAERELEKLGIFQVDPDRGVRPTVSMLEPDDRGVYKDILVQVQEK